MQVSILAEGGMAPDAINRNSDKLSSMFLELRQYFVVQRHLVAANRTPVGRVEGQDYWPPPKLGERDGLVWRNVQGEVGRLCARRKYMRHLDVFPFVILERRNARECESPQRLGRTVALWMETGCHAARRLGSDCESVAD